MPQEFLNYYQEERHYYQQRLIDFAKKYPDVAVRLGLNKEDISENSLDRLVASASLLNARLRFNLADPFSNMAIQLLEKKCPHYLGILPSASVAQIQFLPDLEIENYTLPARTILVNKEQHAFMTIYPVDYIPLRLENATIQYRPFIAPEIPENFQRDKINAVFHLRLQLLRPKIKIQVDKLCFYINAKEKENLFNIIDAICNQESLIQICWDQQTSSPFHLTQDHLMPMGFELNENLFPHTNNLSKSTKLLTDFYVLPEKFLFFSIHGVKDFLNKRDESTSEFLNIYIYMRNFPKEIVPTIHKDTFKIHCTPIVNIFDKNVQRIELNNFETSYTLHIQDSAKDKIDVVAIDKVIFDSVDNISDLEKTADNTNVCFKNCRLKRRFPWQKNMDDSSKSFKNIIEVEIDTKKMAAHATVNMSVYCCQPRIYEFYSAQKGNIHFKFEQRHEMIQSLNLLAPITPPFYPAHDRDSLWPRVSFYQQSLLFLDDPAKSAQALAELLKLFQLNPRQHEDLLGAFSKLYEKTKMHRWVSTKHDRPVRWGYEITLILRKETFQRASILLLARILEALFVERTRSDSFIELHLQTETGKILYSGVPLAGEG